MYLKNIFRKSVSRFVNKILNRMFCVIYIMDLLNYWFINATNRGCAMKKLICTSLVRFQRTLLTLKTIINNFTSWKLFVKFKSFWIYPEALIFLRIIRELLVISICNRFCQKIVKLVRKMHFENQQIFAFFFKNQFISWQFWEE